MIKFGVEGGVKEMEKTLKTLPKTPLPGLQKYKMGWLAGLGESWPILQFFLRIKKKEKKN